MNQQLTVDSLLKAETNTCVLDGKDYLDWYEHVYQQDDFVDNLHARHFQEARENNWDYFCYCGAPIVTSGLGEDGWVTECVNPNCRFLFDED